MNRNMVAGLLAGLVAMGGSAAWSQTQVGTIDYNDLSKRSTARSVREERKEKEREEAKKKAEEEKRRKEREKEKAEDAKKREGKSATTLQTKGTTDSKENQKTAKAAAGAKGRATQPVNTGGSQDPTSQPVTEVMLNAVKTRTVEFDLEEARQDPDVILLNAPKFDPSQRTRAGDTPVGIAEPL